MRLSVTSWSFPKCTLAEAAGIAKTLGIDGIDVGYFYVHQNDMATVYDVLSEAVKMRDCFRAWSDKP
jgi:hypothetical protein